MRNYHFAELIFRQAEKYGSRTALKQRDDATGKWIKISWLQFAERILCTSQAMAEYGIEAKENIGVYSQNMPQCLYIDFGAFRNRAVTVPMYATSSFKQVEYIVKDANIHFLFVGQQLQYNNAFKVQKENGGILKRLIIFDPSVKIYPDDTTSIYFEDFIRLGINGSAESLANARAVQAEPDDIATLIYTSGTTGEPKGVVITHRNYLEAMRIHDIRLTYVTDKDLTVSFLPLTHVFEKTWVFYCLHKGVRVAINQDPHQIQRTLKEIHPTLMCNVPRFWEKVYTGVNQKIEHSGKIMQKLFLNAIQTGKEYNLNYRRLGISAPFGLAFKFYLYKHSVFLLLKKVLGLEKGNAFPVAGAPLSNTIAEFLISVDIPIVYGYGLSETTATVCCFPEKNYTIGSIGTIMPDIQVKIDPETNEILVKGETVTKEYYKKPAETAKAFTEDGFFRTGDAGRLEGDTLYFLERIKDLYKTSNGKYIAPQVIEMSFSGDTYIEQIAVIADERKFVSALIVPSFPDLEAYAKEHGIEYEGRADLISKEAIYRMIFSRIEGYQKDFATYEKIKRFTLLPEPFSMEKGELTDTLKLRRNVIAQRYKDKIDAMYVEKDF
ncbi:long-chain fatty acid--CoA ligase [Parabacteroides sp. Marseille-P3160]|uniref:AMP-dependent synthetase/ligase n=1 Tax=Parabacteroides sp. Marseille-P3160 TaxID=1917887 RepID=UPI0009B985FC|nr:long-chain fatty acid--CoA ligase [Parabacteroides sp. Marseille-P3160]